MTEYKLPIKTLRLWQIRIAFLDVLVLAICLYLPISLSLGLQIYILFTVAILFVIFLYLPEFIRDFSIKIMGDSVVINKGVFIKTTHIMPYARLIYTEIYISPIAKSFGLTAVSLKAVRSRVFIPEMINSDVREILALISKGDTLEKSL